MAERQGFEPWRRGHRLHAFQACAFGHSATSPHLYQPQGLNFRCLPKSAHAGLTYGRVCKQTLWPPSHDHQANSFKEYNERAST